MLLTMFDCNLFIQGDSDMGNTWIITATNNIRTVFEQDRKQEHF